MYFHSERSDDRLVAISVNGTDVRLSVFGICYSCLWTPLAVRVLAFETVAAKSHWNFMRVMLHALTARGHMVMVCGLRDTTHQKLYVLV